MKFLKSKIFLTLIILFTSFMVLAAGLYLKVLPMVVSSSQFEQYVQESLKKSLNMDVEIKNPVLKTSLSPDIYFGLEGLNLHNGKKTVLKIDNLNLNISLAGIIGKKVVVKNVSLKYLYGDLNKIMDMPVFSQSPKQKKENDWFLDIFESVLQADNAELIYSLDENTSIQIHADGLKIDDNVLKKNVNYKIAVDVFVKNKKQLHLETCDSGKVYLKNKEKFYSDNTVLFVNNNKINLFGYCDNKYNFLIELKSDNFPVAYVFQILKSKLIPNELDEILAYFKDPNGNFNFDIKLDNKNINGKIKLNRADFKLVPFMDLPICLNNGNVVFDNDKVTLKDFRGYYNNKPANKADFEGTVKDYLKSVDTDLVGNAIVTNDFAKNYLSKMLGYPVEMEGHANTKLKLKSKYNKIDLTWIYWFKQGSGFLFDGSESTMNDAATRVLAAKMSFDNMLLNIKSINYYALNDKIDRASARIPILSMNGNIDFSNGQTFVKDFGMELPKPMPSGFLNMLFKQRLFRKGTFSGNMKLINTGKYPVLSGDIHIDKVGIPSQRLFINNADVTAADGYLSITSDGRYRRSKYNLKSKIVNELKLPVIVRFAELDIDSVDVEKYLRIFNNQKPGTQTAQQRKDAVEEAARLNISEDSDDDASTFDLANLIIEKCIFKIEKGFYKDINFSDVLANLTLDKDSVLRLDSNKFDIAQGTSSADIVCDMKNHLYKMRLALINVNSDLIATTLLNLPKEINGKASGLIELNTDDSLKLNGRIKFKVSDGIIAKIGLVEYAMKVAAIFRNPVAMITPSIISDLVSVPEGKFDRIDGELKLVNNIVQPMMIKSSSSNLSSFIIGTYNLESQDAALRIYTKFSTRKKGVYGFLRNISLNSLANRIPLSSRNDTNYYESEISQLPPIEAEDKDCQIFLTKVDGDIVQYNFLSSLKKIK